MIKFTKTILIVMILMFCFSCERKQTDDILKANDAKEVLMKDDEQIHDELVAFNSGMILPGDNGIKNDMIIIDNDGGTNKKTWEIKYYIDEFEEYEKYLEARFEGKYEDKTFDGSRKCDFVLLVDDSVRMQIFKVGFVKISEDPLINSSYEYRIALRENNGEKVNFTGTMIDDQIFIDNYGSEYIINCLKKSSKFKLGINEDIYNSLNNNVVYNPFSKYLVEIDSSNFNSLYWK